MHTGAGKPLLEIQVMPVYYFIHDMHISNIFIGWIPFIFLS